VRKNQLPLAKSTLPTEQNVVYALSGSGYIKVNRNVSISINALVL